MTQATSVLTKGPAVGRWMSFVATSILLAPILMLCSGCAAAGRIGAPPAPDRAWYPPGLHDYETELVESEPYDEAEAPGIKPELDKVYDLPALIDIAQRSNPQTRIAWERARQAAAAVGLSESAYYPILAASAGAGYERAFLPFPKLEVGPGPTDVSIKGGGNLTTEAVDARAVAGLKWLLFDFGERNAVRTMAKEGLMMANVGFNAIHQQVVFAVTRRYYELNTARQKVEVAASALSAADTVKQAVQARLDNGLATKPEVLQAEQQSAQAAFDLEAARGVLSDAQVALVNSLGILPTTELQVAEMPDEPMADTSLESREQLIERALSQRPDLVAKLAQVRAKRAEVAKARAAFFPKVSLSANAGWAYLDVSAENSPYFGGDDPVYGAGLKVEYPIFEGFARQEALRIAESNLRQAEAELRESQDATVREVWKAKTDLETAVRKEESAVRLRAAAESAFEASLEAYRHGLGTYVDVANAQRSVTAARAVGVDTRAAIYTTAAALALSVGDLAKPAPTISSGDLQ